MTEIKYPLKHALCEFKKNKVKIVKGKENPFYKAKYADLPEILNAIEGDLSELGVIVSSDSILTDSGWVLSTKIEHIDSDEIKSSSFPLFGNKPQEFGSSITYARRYNIQSLLNLAAEDDDGNSANNAKPMSESSSKKQPEPKKELTPEQQAYAKYMADIKACKNGDVLQRVWEVIQGEDDYKKLPVEEGQKGLRKLFDKQMELCNE